MKPLTGLIRGVAFRFWRQRIRHTLDRPHACQLLGLDFVIEPGVLHPGHFASSLLLAQHVERLDLRDRRVADIGTGSGLLALLAARAGATVTAVDINPVAIACARANALRNGLAHMVSTVVSDVWDGVTDTRFDLIITNPPFYPRTPLSLADLAFAAGIENNFFKHLAEGVPARMSEGGRLVLIESSDTPFATVATLLEAQGLTGRAVRVKRGLFETLTIHEFGGRG